MNESPIKYLLQPVTIKLCHIPIIRHILTTTILTQHNNLLLNVTLILHQLHSLLIQLIHLPDILLRILQQILQLNQTILLLQQQG